MTLDGAAAFLTISKSSVRRLQAAGRLPFMKIGGSLRFARHDLLAYVAKRRVVLDHDL
jgi:excisionase family DNA binding protein